MTTEKIIMELDKEIREKVFKKFASIKVNNETNKNEFKSMIEEQLKKIHKGTGFKYDIYFEGDNLIVRPYAEKISFTITLDK